MSNTNIISDINFLELSIDKLSSILAIFNVRCSNSKNSKISLEKRKTFMSNLIKDEFNELKDVDLIEETNTKIRLIINPKTTKSSQILLNGNNSNESELSKYEVGQEYWYWYERTRCLGRVLKVNKSSITFGVYSWEYTEKGRESQKFASLNQTWSDCEIIFDRDNLQCKKILFKPEKSLSKLDEWVNFMKTDNVLISHREVDFGN